MSPLDAVVFSVSPQINNFDPLGEIVWQQYLLICYLHPCKHSPTFTFSLCFILCILCLPFIFPIAMTSQLSVTSECECHGHADSCHFSHQAWLSSGGISGGVCDDCRHNTVGRRCHRCRHSYHRHPSLSLNSPHACTRKINKEPRGMVI